MSDPRDFDMRWLPAIEAVLATGVPESCSRADLFAAPEARASVALDRGQTHYACPQCASCHCHDCVMQEREVKRQAVQALVDERDELRERVARLERRSAGYSDSSLYWLRRAGERFEDIRRLRAALEKYGCHRDECETSDWVVGTHCTCGLAEALKGAEEEKE